MQSYHVLLCMGTFSLMQPGVHSQWNFNPQWDAQDGATRDKRAARPYDWQQWNPREDGRCPWYQWHDKPDCPPDSPLNCYEPPYFPYDEIEIEIPGTGWVVGRSMSYAQFRYINVFQGIPYAKPPIRDLRFKKPEDPGPEWDRNVLYWCADYYRDACPQELWRQDDNYYQPRNMSEDCLHLNIFAPNLTDRPREQNKNFPVFVFIDGEDYKLGDAKLYPGHVVARKEVLVVTFNYRLGALGFLSTLDEYSPGNYGLHDIMKVLEFIQRYIVNFRGNPNKVTLVGSGSGASSAGLLMLQERKYQGRRLFHNVIMMSGTDLCEWATVGTIWNADAATYTGDLAREVGCDPNVANQPIPSEYLLECLREKHYDEIVNGSANVQKRYGSLAGPFGPVVDGVGGLIPDEPDRLRANGNYMKVKMMTGVTKDEGAYVVDELTKDLIGVNMDEGLDPATFREIVTRMVKKRSPIILNTQEVVSAIEYEYTYWSKPDNKTAVRQNLVDLWSDMVWGWCMDAALKYHAECDDQFSQCEPVYMYEFAHRSEYEVLPLWMGVPNGKTVDYLFGHPFFNESMGNVTGVIPDQWEWTYMDKNISEFVQDMWVNFTKFDVPTTDWKRNVTWYPFSQFNLSYLRIEADWSRMEINYRQNHYAFWREYYPSLSSRERITTTPQPTPYPLIPYQYATWALVGASLVAIFIMTALGITLWRRSKAETEYD